MSLTRSRFLGWLSSSGSHDRLHADSTRKSRLFTVNHRTTNDEFVPSVRPQEFAVGLGRGLQSRFIDDDALCNPRIIALQRNKFDLTSLRPYRSINLSKDSVCSLNQALWS